MSHTSHRVRRLVVVVAVLATASAVARRRVRGTPRGAGIVPVIGGDTWPPVPVKEARTA